MKIYAGIGSRETPQEILVLMSEAAKALCIQGYTLRSGGAPGADAAFESGVYDHKKKEIYLPWRSFNCNTSTRHRVTDEALLLAGKYHPAWDKLPHGARKLMGRNCYQVLGDDLNSPSDFVLCWTKNGKDVGGTAQAIRIAKDKGIPVFNLFFPEIQDKIKSWISSGVSL
jgi:hypothetical protein